MNAPDVQACMRAVELEVERVTGHCLCYALQEARGRYWVELPQCGLYVAGMSGPQLISVGIERGRKAVVLRDLYTALEYLWQAAGLDAPDFEFPLNVRVDKW